MSYRFRNCLSFSVLKRLATQFILPVMDYSDDWNNLPAHIRSISSFVIFKRALSSHLNLVLVFIEATIIIFWFGNLICCCLYLSDLPLVVLLWYCHGVNCGFGFFSLLVFCSFCLFLFLFWVCLYGLYGEPCWCHVWIYVWTPSKTRWYISRGLSK